MLEDNEIAEMQVMSPRKAMNSYADRICPERITITLNNRFIVEGKLHKVIIEHDT